MRDQLTRLVEELVEEGSLPMMGSARAGSPIASHRA